MRASQPKRAWNRIASKFPGRTELEVREKWYDETCTVKRQLPWTPKDDEKLADLEGDFTKSWKSIEEEFNFTRTRNGLRLQWRSLKLHRPEVEEGRAADLAWKKAVDEAWDRILKEEIDIALDKPIDIRETSMYDGDA